MWLTILYKNSNLKKNKKIFISPCNFQNCQVVLLKIKLIFFEKNFTFFILLTIYIYMTTQQIYNAGQLTSIVKEIRSDKRIIDNDTELAKMLNIALLTLYKRLVDENWKQKEIQKINEIIEQFPFLIKK